MSTLTKYFCREFFKLLIICLVIFVSIYLVIHFFGRFDNFSEAHVPMSRMIPYLLYQIPYIVVQMLPPATLIAVIILFSLMKKNNEIIALKACGISLWKISRPLLVVSLFLCAILFVFSEIAVPYASSKSNGIWRIEVEKQEPAHLYGRRHIWYKGPDCIYWIKQLDYRKRTLKGLSLYFFDENFGLRKIVEGREGIWKEGKWNIKDARVLESAGSRRYRLRTFREIQLKLPETPETFMREEKSPEEMGYWQLKRFARRLRLEGYDATRYLVELNMKLSFPFIVFIMVLMGIPIALREKRGGMPMAVTLGMLFCLVYLFVLGFSRSMGLAGLLPPILSTWLANGIFLCLGVYMINLDP